MQLILNEQEVKEMLEREDKESGLFGFDAPIFVKERRDVCALLMHEESGADRIFLVWRNRSGIKHKQLTRYEGGALELGEIFKTRRHIVVNVRRNGFTFGSFWIPLLEMNLEDSFN